MGANQTTGRLLGVVTERELWLAESSFPGIGELYRRSPQRYTTFLELVWAYQERAVLAF